MNEPNHLENLLHSWTPRRPSASLRERLFAGNIPSTPQWETPVSPKWGWLGPATVCAFTMLVILGNHSHSPTQLGDTNLFFASITMTSVPPAKSESSSVFALTKHDLNLEQNVWREAILESTNQGQSPSSKRSLPVRETNSLTL